jgi:hypothetical protein
MPSVLDVLLFGEEPGANAAAAGCGVEK